jgi:asparagine synthase (glutamine-hydrolysing)
MCSIAGSRSKEEVKKMLSLMKHRAPDDEAIVDNGIWLGMGRLAIIDLTSAGLCPIQYKDKTLVFNGELYNYLEVREKLTKLNYQFTTKGDSEVLLKAYHEWGEKCLDKFNFMGALAISDGHKIFLARDIAGEKPLYFQLNPFKFASEAKALNFDCIEFPPAHYAIYDIEKSAFDIKRWWTPPPPKKTYQGSFEEALTKLEELLGDAVKLRTQADVPFGLYYSTGIDSTLISSFYNFQHKFTYQDKDYEEEFKNIFPKIVWHLDSPIKSFSPFGLWKLAEKASKKVKVVLSGEGADELFGGYVRYIPNEFHRLARIKFPSYKEMFPYEDKMSNEFHGNMRELLRMGDRMSSAFGIESRCPFLDRRIIEFAMSLPMEWKINGFETKVILRRLLEKRRPDYKHIEKKGLYCSVNKWIGAEKEGFGKESYLKLQHQIVKKYTDLPKKAKKRPKNLTKSKVL